MAGVVAQTAVRLQVRNSYAILRMMKGDNRWNGMFVDDFNRALDQTEGDPNINFLVLTGEGKFFNYGLDLPWIAKQTLDVNTSFFKQSETFLTRVTTFPMPTVAAMNGHAFGIGAVLALACDYRVMRMQHGWFCLPETKYKMQIAAGTRELIRRKLSRAQTLRDAVVFGKQYTAEDALEAGIVEAAVDQSELVDTAVKIGQDVAGDGLDRATVALIKDQLYGAAMREKYAEEKSTVSDRSRAFVRNAQILASSMK